MLICRSAQRAQLFLSIRVAVAVVFFNRFARFAIFAGRKFTSSLLVDQCDQIWRVTRQMAVFQYSRRAKF